MTYLDGRPPLQGTANANAGVTLRDLDYVNPRQRTPNCALPPDVRSALGFASDTNGATHDGVYSGAANFACVLGGAASGAGTERTNRRGHAFLRRGTAHSRREGAESSRKEALRWRVPRGNGTGRCTRPVQQGCAHSNAGVTLRDLDYVNPRQRAPRSALPPELRSGGGAPSATTAHASVYSGAANVETVLQGASGAGTDWANARGHAFVRRGTAEQRSDELRLARKRDAQLRNALGACG